ncbi:hypothetical protein Phi12:1_gp7 [Cellulophaga phage phi12:1]|uniref:Uncharacterized protein n=2 Tax=Cellulophaga phage phi12:1 TaxID=1327976 RepID=S0A177_9CAUD|nr:hypothetical protein Phi12:1_gp7 [Cellulophaga phage phi12:1]AGO47973.1 hypothetical protein Phi12:1_gp7 [Cellulophaga phage phi12:1]AGO48138.1 hypothetical protein Phi12:3_gp7 [Cellulophaga phage phi12:3]
MKVVTIEVSKKPWAETPLAWGIPSIPGPLGFNKVFFYPKTKCKYKDGFLDLPYWMYNKNFSMEKNKPVILRSVEVEV